jgi:acyl carrier protein
MLATQPQKSNINYNNHIMEIKDFIENFADIFDDVDAAELTPDTKFRELDEWSSLMALSIIAMADDEYDVEINGDDIRNSTTIADLFEIVKRKA